MGSYIPIKRRLRRRKSVAETLAEAESDHFLDCPTAEFKWRAACSLLDFIFIFLMISGVNHIANLIMHTSLGSEISQLSYEDKIGLLAIKLALQSLLVFAMCIWPVVAFGGSPGKLLLGLQVVDVTTGRLLSYPQVFLREIVGKFLLGSLTMSVGLLLPLVRGDSRALQDLISRSVVKKVH
jgi:uncharacterized RDD family membrane protein YckC